MSEVKTYQPNIHKPKMTTYTEAEHSAAKLRVAEAEIRADQERQQSERALNAIPDMPLTTKDTNPKDAVGVRKVPFLSVIPMGVIGELALALLEGARKYGRHNYRKSGVRASVYMDAQGRHMAAWWEGEDMDRESNLNHVTKAIATLTVLRDSMMTGNWVDDRPPATLPTGWVAGQNQAACWVIDRIPDAKEPFTQNPPAPLPC